MPRNLGTFEIWFLPKHLIQFPVVYVLGLGHSRTRGSVMLPYYHNTYSFARRAFPVLGQDDVEGIRALYDENHVITPRLKTVEPVGAKAGFVKIESICEQAGFDATAVIRNELFLFKIFGLYWPQVALLNPKISQATCG